MAADKELLEKERAELNVIINKGVSFEVKDTEFATERRFFGLSRKRVAREVTRTFRIEEMTLATLDRLSSEWIEFALDEERMKGQESMSEARMMAHNHAIRCARIIAIAVLGESRLVPVPAKGGTRWVEDGKAVEELTSLFARKIRPSRLYQLVVMVSTMSNLPDFINSIRLMSIQRTTVPDRIESGRGD